MFLITIFKISNVSTAGSFGRWGLKDTFASGIAR